MSTQDILELVDEGRIRRIFRARNKIAYPGAVCHITQRSTGKEPLFLEEGDYLHMLHLVKEDAAKFNFELFSHSLMPNHLHLFIRLFKDNLSNAMKVLFWRYARFFNQKYGRKGHVFGASFRQALCFSDSYLLAASLYIHLNAVRASLVSRPESYRWSSCRLFVEPFEGTTFLNHKFILGILHDDIDKARKIYREMLDNAVGIKAQEVWEKPEALELFRINIREFLPKAIKTKERTQDDFLGERELEEKIAQLKAEGRLRSPEMLNARKFLVEQLRARGYSMEGIAEMLGVSRQTLYLTLQNMHCTKCKVAKVGFDKGVF